MNEYFCPDAYEKPALGWASLTAMMFLCLSVTDTPEGRDPSDYEWD